MLAVVNLPAEERGACSMLLRLLEQLERIVGGATGAAEDSCDEMRIVRNQFLHRGRTVIGDFQEYRARCGGYAGKRARDPVIDESAEIMRACAAAGIGI